MSNTKENVLEKKPKNTGLNISAKSFISAVIILFVLMVVAYVLSFVLQGGAFDRVKDANGNLVIVANSYHAVEGGIPFWKWILSPILVLTGSGNLTIIAVLIFLIVIGGIFSSLNSCGIMQYMLEKLTFKFANVRYKLMAILILFFMAMGSLIGSFEECVPLVPIITVLSLSLGWDALTGVSMSLLSAGCGFAAGVFNPFSVGVAQELAGLQMFSGAWLRIVAFICIYGLLFGLTYLHAKRIEKPLQEISLQANTFVYDKKKDKGLLTFAIIMGIGIVTILSSIFITFLQDFTMYIVAVMFLVAGIASVKVAGMSGKDLGKTFGSGVVSMLPAVLMILMASSIKYTLETAYVMDTILNFAIQTAKTLPKWTIILFIYLIVLIMNFFIASGSAKAFMLIPLIVPIAQSFGISAQLCVLAYAFGDGFSNVFYPTNPVLIISLGVTDISYPKWVKYSYKFQLLNLILTSGLLLLGLVIGY